MFAIAVLVGLLTAFVSSVCTAVDEAHEANTGEESDACAINPLIYICAILDILAAATLFVFGYAVCCCTKDKDAQVAVAAPQVVIVQAAAQPVAAVAVPVKAVVAQ